MKNDVRNIKFRFTSILEALISVRLVMISVTISLGGGTHLARHLDLHRDTHLAGHLPALPLHSLLADRTGGSFEEFF